MRKMRGSVDKNWKEILKLLLCIVLFYGLVGDAHANVNTEKLISNPKWLYALSTGNCEVILNWRYDGNAHLLGYNVYRSLVSKVEYKKINKSLINTTSYIDKGLRENETYYYIVRAVDSFGKESRDSNKAKVKIDSKKSDIVLTINHYGGDVHFGDLDNDGDIDFLFSKWDEYKKTYNNEGLLMWEVYPNSPDGPLHYNVEHDPTPTAIWDIDGDSKNEVICQYYLDNGYYLAILDGATGEIKKRVEMPERFHKLAIANFRGRDIPQDILINIGEDCGYQLRAYTNNLILLWKWNSKNPNLEVAHYPQPGDIDDDGKDEVVLGRVILESDGSVKYRINPGSRVTHADSIVIDDLIPDLSGKEIIIGWEGPLIGLYQGTTGKVIWEKSSYIDNGYHVHRVKVGDILRNNPGKEILFTEKSDRPPYKIALVDGRSGNLIWKKSGITIQEATLISWTGAETKEVLGDNFIIDGYGNKVYSREKEINKLDFFAYNFNLNLFVCDIIGDYREEYLIGDGNKVYIHTNIDYNPLKKPSPWEDINYQKEIANWNLY